MPSDTHPLTFELLDDLLLARERARVPSIVVAPGLAVGPLVELLCAGDGLSAIRWPQTPVGNALEEAQRRRRPVYRSRKTLGVVPALAATGAEGIYWDAFMFEMFKAMRAASWPSGFSSGFVGAMNEMHSNTHEHSGAPTTGVIAYRITEAEVEWVVTDRGVGVLGGFQAGAYPSLSDSGKALQMALAEGCSRTGIPGRGNGFRELFKALSARQGRLRFRSDDQLLTITGESPSLSRAQLHQRADVAGFTINVVCLR